MPTTSRWAILAIFVVSGAAGLVYEIVWSRQLVLVFGNTTQAVSAILAGFFGGMDCLQKPQRHPRISK
jgi:spermidine synthase